MNRRPNTRLWLAVLVATLSVLAGGSLAPLPSSAASSATGSVMSDEGAGNGRFVGSWRVVSFRATTAAGQNIYPLGPDAQGVLTYTHDGRMSGTLWRSGRQPFAVPDQQKGTPEEYTAAVQSYIQYLGTFTIDRDAGTISHHVEQSIFPNWNGSVQTRFYAFSPDGEELSLFTPPIQFGGTTLVAYVDFERM